jgi:hypothetical protein
MMTDTKTKNICPECGMDHLALRKQLASEYHNTRLAARESLSGHVDCWEALNKAIFDPISLPTRIKITYL